MPSNVFRFDEHWDLPNVRVEDVYAVLSHGALLPKWWKGVYLEAVPQQPGDTPKVGDKLRARARGALPYELNFILEAVTLEPNRKVVVRSIGDFEGLWTATLSQQGPDVRVDIIWQVTVLRPILKFLAPLLRPAFAWNHRWTTPRGEKGLREYLKEQGAQQA